MSKNPAFLFYSQDFYTGTRTMLPEERACYMDLLIYQHQNNGLIPLDLKRVQMFCSGVDIATLQATLKAKFIQTEKGYYNKKLNEVMTERESYTNSQSLNGKIGFFFKKLKNSLTKTDFLKFEKKLKTLDKSTLLEVSKKINFKNKDTLKDTLIASLKHIENEDENENENINEKEKGNENKKNTVEKIIFPFDDPKFLNAWQLWKVFKNKEFSFNYKSQVSEQAALKKLSELAKQNPKTAIKIIHQSIENGWKGLFELNTSKNGTRNNQTAGEQHLNNMQKANQTVDEFFDQ